MFHDSIRANLTYADGRRESELWAAVEAGRSPTS